MKIKDYEREILKNLKIPRQDYDIALNSIKRMVKLHGKAGIVAVIVAGCEMGEAIDKMDQGEESK